jgi:glutamate-1-semialdehyde aminotransferase
LCIIDPLRDLTLPENEIPIFKKRFETFINRQTAKYHGDGMQRDAVIKTVYIPVNMLNELRRIAKQKDTSVNALIVEAIAQWLEKEKGG